MTNLLAKFVVRLILVLAPMGHAAVETTLPVSAEIGTSIASELFPVTVKLSKEHLYLTDPGLLFVDPRRIGLQVRIEAYDYRPAEGIAISETGRALVTGELGYDSGTREVLLHNPRINTLEFDRQNAVTQRLSVEINTAWSARVTNPVRVELPPHPYLLPFRNNLKNLSYDGKSIKLIVSY